MQAHDIEDRVMAELAGMPGLLVDPDDIKPDMRLREDLGLESVSLILLIVAIEDAFNIRVDPLTADLEEALESVTSLIAFVRGQLGQ